MYLDILFFTFVVKVIFIHGDSIWWYIFITVIIDLLVLLFHLD